MSLIQVTTEVTNCALAIEETITTPTPGLGHGKLADCVALATFALSTLHIIAL